MKDIAIFLVWFIPTWYLMGCIVLGLVDTDGRIFKWAYKDSPRHYYGFIVTILFPIIVYIYLKDKYKK